MHCILFVKEIPINSSPGKSRDIFVYIDERPFTRNKTEN